MKVRKSSKIARLVKGNEFFDPKTGDLLIVNGFPVDRRDDGTISVPVIRNGSNRPSRRRFDASLRVSLV